MSLYRLRIAVPFAVLLMMLLAACGGSSTPRAQSKPTPTPKPGQGQQLLSKAAQKLNTAKTLHAIFDLALSGQVFNGTLKTEMWNEGQNKNRTVVLQSTVSSFPVGSITVSNGKQVWEYDPVKKVVYTGPVTSNGNAGTPTAGGSNRNEGTNQFILGVVQAVFTQSDATLVSASAHVNGRDVYDIHVVPQSQAKRSGGGNFDYDGDVYLDKATMLPVQVNLMISGFGRVLLNVPMLVLNAPVAESLFTFVPPRGVKVLPLQQANQGSGTGTLTLAEAEAQAGYHLLSIPASQTAYALQGVDVLGAPGNQIYALNYVMGNTTFTISEGKPLANLPGSGQQVSLRGTTAVLSTSSSSTTLTWTEKGIGIQIAGKLSAQQIETIAKLLT